MKVIYENKVKASGIAVEEFKDAGMFIIFGENAPEEIRDYCYKRRDRSRPVPRDRRPGIQDHLCRL